MSPEQLRSVAEHFKALGDAGRLRILQALRGGELTATEAAVAAGLHQANASKHLQLLHTFGFVVRRRDGTHVYYRLAGDAVDALCDIALRRLHGGTSRGVHVVSARPLRRAMERRASRAGAGSAAARRMPAATLPHGERYMDKTLPDQPVHVGAAALDELVSTAELPVLVDFYADWCGPCRFMAPVLDRFARANAGKVIVAKLDTDDHPEPAMRLGIRSIPTLVLFVNGREADRQVGAVSAEYLENMLATARD